MKIKDYKVETRILIEKFESTSFIDDIDYLKLFDASPTTYRAKIEALANYCNVNGKSYRVVLDVDLKAYTKKAFSYHETQKKNNYSI